MASFYAQLRLADEYDAGQERGEVARAKDGASWRSERERPPTAANIGLTRKDFYEALSSADAAWGTAKSQQYRLLLSRLWVPCNSFAGLGVSCPFALRFPRACRTTLLGARRFGSVLRPAQPVTTHVADHVAGAFATVTLVLRAGFAGLYGLLPVLLIGGLVLVALQLIDSRVFGWVLDCLLGGRNLRILGHDDIHCCALLGR